MKEFEPIQSQEELHMIPGSNATTTVNGIDIASYRNKHKTHEDVKRLEGGEASIESRVSL